jgi:hypothetical protein
MIGAQGSGPFTKWAVALFAKVATHRSLLNVSIISSGIGAAG